MYKQLHTKIKLTEKFFDKENFEKIKFEINNNEYGNIEENLKTIILGLPTFKSIVHLLGFDCQNINYDTYYCDLFAIIDNLDIAKKFLTNYKKCFDKSSKITLICRNSLIYYQFDFDVNEFVEKRLPLITIENNNEIIYLDMKDNKLIDFNENKIDLSIYELFELLLDAWEKDNLLYEIKKELGLFTCSCNFTTKNNQKISIYGYANRKELALNDCDKHIAILKEIFRKGSESK